MPSFFQKWVKIQDLRRLSFFATLFHLYEFM